FALAAGFTSSDLESLRLKMSNPDELWEMYLQYKSIFRYIAHLYEWESNVDVTSQNLLLILEERYAQTTRDQFRSSYDAWLGGKLNIDPHARANDEWISESGNLLPSVGTCDLQQSFAAYTWCQRRYQEGEKMHGKGKELLAIWAKIIRDYHG